MDTPPPHSICFCFSPLVRQVFRSQRTFTPHLSSSFTSYIGCRARHPRYAIQAPQRFIVGRILTGSFLSTRKEHCPARQASTRCEISCAPTHIVPRYRTTMQNKSKPDREAEYRALADFRYHIRRYLDFSDQAAKKAGIESKQYQLLLAIRGLPEEIEPTVGTLAQRLGLRHHSSVELINRAEANQLVKRSRNGARVLVKLTDKGQRVLSRGVEERLQELRVAGPVLVEALQQLIHANHVPKRKRK